MQYKNIAALSSLLSLAAAKPIGQISKRDEEITWGPMIQMGPTSDGVEITQVIATIYPGNMPKTQAGGLYNWIGINNETETGDLVQGIVGSYIHGQSECSGAKADSLWCISSEVYGYDSSQGGYNQYVGDETTLATTPADGITFNYTLINSETGMWYQNARNARTGDLMSEYKKKSPSMTMLNTAVECQSCTPPTDIQYWTDITIKLSGADKNFGSSLYAINQASNTDPTTSDSGKTWSIKNVTIPVVDPVAN